jgi:Tol biopolymer transport system component
MEGKSANALFLIHEKKLIMLTDDSVKVGPPSLSIYTNKIAFLLEENNGDDIYIMNLDGSGY